ncbi:SCO7613 C-terminal domain-containing membrane protein [Clavibacter sp. VKM Ac-2542]|uniref:SCO7613 C-terminal domain-containing membrane protein n=1 Tax=Clavibacter sp. VKM Ac-2542 TaxID=2783811 RepID=UPI00188D2A1D|nr:hypothetical protein [Clavibacter sp. VKM Ac-2542]MBF4620052.1 hypothetical protein [Clavibacter sp. VKM Ac-2542]
MVEDDARGSRIPAQAWAASADDLVRTDLCPGCLAPLGALVCGSCGLDVRAPGAAAVLEASHRVVEAIAERERLVDAMRRWSEEAVRRRGAVVVASAVALVPESPATAIPDPRRAAPLPTAEASSDTAPAIPAPTGPAPEADARRLQRTPIEVHAPEPAVPAAPRRRISVPAVLLAIGVVLLSVAAVFYVVYAFVTYGLVVRAAITAAVTVAALAAAAVLARRRLPGTAEAVGVVGIVLLHLDVWAVRSYDLAGAASNDPFVHFGVGTLVVSASLLVLAPLLRIRAAGIAGWAGLTVAAGLLVGAVPTADVWTRVALALAAASAVALVHAAPRSRAAALPDALERGILRVVGVVTATAAVTAGAASAAAPDAVPALPLLVAAVASGAHAWALARPTSRAELRGDVADVDVAAPADDVPPPAEAAAEQVTSHGGAADTAPASADPLRVLAAAVAGVGASAALPVTALMGGPAVLTFGIQLVVAAAVAAGLDVLSRRLHDPVVAATARMSAVAALVVTVVAGLPAAIAGLGGITAVLLLGLPAWEHGALDDAVVVLSRTSDVADLPGDVRAAAVGLVVVWVLAAAAALVTGRLQARRRLLAWTGAAVVIAAIPALGPVAVVAGAYLVASAGALAWRVRSRRDPGPAVVPTAPLVALSVTAGALAWAASWASTSTWWVVAPAVVLLLAAGSRTARTEGSARLATAGAALVGLVVVAALAPSLTAGRVIGSAPLTSALDSAGDPVVLVLLTSGLAASVAGALPGRPGVRRRALLATVLLPAGLAAPLVAIAGADRVGGALTGSPIWSIAAQAVLLAGLVAWTVGGARGVPLPARAPRADAQDDVPRPPGTTALRRWRLTTAALVAPSLLLAVLTASALVDRGATPHGVIPAAVALVVAVAALLCYRRTSPALRIALDAGTTAVATGAMLVAVSFDPTREGRELLWIPLLALAGTACTLSYARDGLLLSRSARRAWGWTALATGIAASWSRLLAGAVTSPEAYWLPIGGALLLIAALMHHAAVGVDRDGDVTGSTVGPRVRRGVTALTLAGILTAVLPLVAAGRPDDVLRPYLMTGICAALALGGAALLRHAASPVRPLLRAVVIGAGIGILAVGGVRALRLSTGSVGRETAVDVQMVVTAVLLVGLGALVLRGARSAEDARLAGSAWVGTSVLVAVVMAASVGSGEGVVRPLVVSVALVAGAGVLLVLRSVHREVLAASAAMALVGAVVVALLAWRGGYTALDPAALVVPAIVAVLVAAVGAADRLRNPAPVVVPGRAPGAVAGPIRHAADAATGALVAGTVAVGAASGGPGLPVALLLSAVAVLVASSAPGSRARRHAGWMALALGTAALWVALGRGRIDAVEPYVLPPAGVLLAVAALLQRGLPRGLRHDATQVPGRTSGAAPVLLGALLLAALPTAVASWTGTPVRALVLGGATGAVLLLAAAALRGTDAASPTGPLLLATAVASGFVVPLVGFGRAVSALVAQDPATFARTDLWTLSAAAVLVLAVGLLPRRAEDLLRRDHAVGVPASGPIGKASDAWTPGNASDGARPATDTLLRAAPRVAGLVALIGAGSAGAAGILLAHAERMDGVGLRAALLVSVIAAMHIACSPSGSTTTGARPDEEGQRPASPPSRDRVLALAALVVSGLVAAILVSSGAADPVETVTVPIAAALLVVGARRLIRDATAGSVRHLSPGLLVLLVPPLLADLGPSPAWRIVGLGVLALATLLTGARLRLRAPFLIGAGVLLVHAVAQLWPWIREASTTVPWWAWAGIGGVVLIAVAARYERRIRDVKEVAARVSALR